MFASPRRPPGSVSAVALAPALLTVLVAVTVLAAGCAPTAPSVHTRPAEPTLDDSTPEAAPSSGTPPRRDRQAVPIYYLVDTPAGTRLYREFHSVPDGDPGSRAVRELLAESSGVDPDYRSAWSGGWTLHAPVRHSGDEITVDLTPPDDGPGPGPETEDQARLGLQQLVYTVQGALRSTDPVRILLAGKPAERLWGLPIAEPVGRADPTATRSLVQVDNPAHGSVVGRNVRVTGEAAVFEANLLWQVLEGNRIVRHGHATAGEAFTFSRYEFTVALPPGDYTLRVFESDVSDGAGRPPFSDTKQFTVR